jgi:uncharacterized protein (DUF1501 family)
MQTLSTTPRGMTRRHFAAHLAAGGAMLAAANHFTTALAAGARDPKRQHKSAILLWMGGGPSTIDLWDLKSGADTGGPFKPIATTGDVQICEHLPKVAQVMRHLSIVRSMSTREADHNRGRYYLHTGYIPNPDVTHPSYGAVVSRELERELKDLQIPPFVSIGGPSEGPGFLGMSHAPFVVGTDGDVRNLKMPDAEKRLADRMQMLQTIEAGFIRQRRGQAAADHAKILDKTASVMTSQQMQAFRVDQEPDTVRERYGKSSLGNGCLMARRLVETGVPFVEVDFGGWDNHQNVFDTLKDDKLPQLDQAMSALVEDLVQRGLLESTLLLWMGEFGRTPRINANVGRDHYARAWSAVIGGCGVQGGIAIGETSEDGAQVTSESHSAEDLMATALAALGIPLNRSYTSNNGRPMKIAGGGTVIPGLLG